MDPSWSCRGRRLAICKLAILLRLSVIAGVMPQVTERIVGGTLVAPGAIPHQVGLVSVGDETPTNCGGSIIDPLYVVTAAHCIKSNTPGERPLAGDEAMTVKYGNVDREDENGPTVHAIYVWVHPRYNYSTFRNDIAVLKLERPIPFSSNISSIRLSADDTPLSSGADLIASGWGKTQEGGEGSRILRTTTLNYLPGICEGIYKEEYFPQEQVCAGCMQGGRGTCPGDSGGPVTARSSSGGCPVLVGITSNGEGCARRNTPIVYTRVSFYLQWLESIVKKPLRTTVALNPTSRCDNCGRHASTCAQSSTAVDRPRCDVEVKLAAAFKLSLISRCTSSSSMTSLSAYFAPEVVNSLVPGGVTAGTVYLLRSAQEAGKSTVRINGTVINAPLKAPVDVVAVAQFNAASRKWAFALNGCAGGRRDNSTYAALYKSPGSSGAYYQISLPVH